MSVYVDVNVTVSFYYFMYVSITCLGYILSLSHNFMDSLV